MAGTHLIAIPAEEFSALVREVRELREALQGAMVIPKPEWVSITEAAAIYGVDRSTIHRWISAGRIEARGAGKAREVRVDQSRRFASSSAVAS